MSEDPKEKNLSQLNSTSTDHQNYKTCREDFELLFKSGFITRVKSEISFIKHKDILDWRYPLHYIKREEISSLEKSWYVEWDRMAYNVYWVKSESERLHFPSGIFSEWERTENDRWFVKTPPMNVHEAIKFYDLLNESRFSL